MISEKQKRFCREYVIDSNATQAAIRAGYSKKTAAEQASRLLTNVKIQEYLQSIQKKVEDKLGASAERTLAEICRIAYGNLPDLFNANGTLKKLDELSDDQKALLSSVESEEISKGKKKGSVKKIKIWDKTKALEMLAKHFGLFEKDNSQKPAVVITDKIVFK